jgi:hypothetical protein
MEQAPPRIAVGILSTLYGGLALLLVGVSVVRGFPPVLIAVDVFWLSLCVALIPPISTELTAEGISQVSLRGRRMYRWQDVTGGRDSGSSLLLEVKDAKVRVPMMLFRRPKLAYKYIGERLPPELIRWHT